MNPNFTMIETPREDEPQAEQLTLTPRQGEAAESLTSVDSLVCYGIILCE